MNILDHIASTPLFQGLPKEHLEDLATVIEDKVFRQGQLIFSEGDEGTGFYVIISGRVKIFKLSLEGKEQILHIFGPGEPIGEVAVFAGKSFPAHAEAMEDIRLLYFFMSGCHIYQDPLPRLIDAEGLSLSINMLNHQSGRFIWISGKCPFTQPLLFKAIK
jgi:hypothetical protein